MPNTFSRFCSYWLGAAKTVAYATKIVLNKFPTVEGHASSYWWDSWELIPVGFPETFWQVAFLNGSQFCTVCAPLSSGGERVGLPLCWLCRIHGGQHLGWKPQKFTTKLWNVGWEKRIFFWGTSFPNNEAQVNISFIGKCLEPFYNLPRPPVYHT